MKQRPQSITIISWIFIVTGIITILNFLYLGSIDNPTVLEVMQQSPFSISFQYSVVYFSSLITIGYGIGMLYGKNLARVIYVGWSIISLTISVVTLPAKMMIIPGVIKFAIFAFFLFRPKANAYFANPAAVISPVKNISILKILRVVLYAIGGFFILMVNFLSFASIPESTVVMKLVIMGVFTVIALIFILIAMATNRFKAWRSPLGISMVSAVGCNILTVLAYFWIQSSPEIIQSVPNFHQDFFSDYLVGGITTVVTLALGLILLRCSSK